MKTNPKWLDASRLAPQFHKQKVSNPPDKDVCIQCFTKGVTAEDLRGAGVTHVWESTKIGGGLSDQIGVCQNYSTQEFGSPNPSEEKVREVARSKKLYDNMLITDEFKEGAFGQVGNRTSEWFYEELSKRAKQEKKTVQLLGEYGSGAINVYNQFKRAWDSEREPMSPYFLSLLGPDIVSKLDEKPGSSGTMLKHYAQTRGKYMGRCVGFYYSMEHPLSDLIATMGLQAIYHYNAVPDQYVMLFTWPKMQSNGVLLDVPEREAGTIRPDGSTGIDFPNCPPEISKIHAFLGCLFYDAVYLWNDYGTKEDDDNKYNGPSIGTDAFFAGIHWYCDLIPTLKEAGRDVVCCDYTVNGQKLAYTGKERRISRRGKPYFGNQYFNEIAAAKRGFALVIPGKRPFFIYLNPYLTPLQSEQVIVRFDNRDWKLGNIPGMTLHVIG